MANVDIVREGAETILKFDYEGVSRIPSIEDDPAVMTEVIDKLVEVVGASKVIFTQKRDYEYDFEQVQLLNEIADLYRKLSRQKELFSLEALKFDGFTKDLEKRYADVQRIIFKMLKSDPIGAYVELKRLIRLEKIKLDDYLEPKDLEGQRKYISLLTYLHNLLDQTKLINVARPYLAGYEIGDRSVYRKILRPSIKPDFMFTKLMASYPVDGEELASYDLGETEITVFKLPDTIHLLYHMIPPEFKLSEDHYEILDSARNIMAEHKPEKEEFTDPERMRQVFFNVGKDLISELADYRNMKLTDEQLEDLTNILVRYTIGFGLIEVLLEDEKIQDVTINSPMGKAPMFIVHADFDNCKTNIIATRTEAESWATKLRLLSGRPLDEANPILDTEITLPGARARVGAITSPLNPTGYAFAFRRHRDKPWTLPLFIKNKMIDPLGAGLVSFIIDGSRTILVAGTRSAGKTSFLGSLLVELMRSARVITIEDTLELPVLPLIDLGYNIQQMKVASAMTRGTAEVPADEGIRTTLRLGDSALFVGEVRSTEARALYEAMRVGALANVVAGTIHGDSPYGVYDRVVNDLQVPKTSFKATDIIIVANPIRSADGLHRWRRITSITEVRKHWEDDPMLEHGFMDLMKYDSKTDTLKPTEDFTHGGSDILKSIAGNVKEWAGNWDAVWDNIQLRADIKKALVDMAEKTNDNDLLEAGFVILANDQFHRISDRVREEVGTLDSKRIFFEWNEWLKEAVKKRSLEHGR